MGKYVYGDRTVMQDLDRAFDVGRASVGGTGVQFRQLWETLTCGGVKVAESLAERGLVTMTGEFDRVPVLEPRVTTSDAVGALSEIVGVSVSTLTPHVMRRLVTDDVKQFARSALKDSEGALYVARNGVDVDEIARRIVAAGPDSLAKNIERRMLGVGERPIVAVGRAADFAWALKCSVEGLSRVCGKQSAMSPDRKVWVTRDRETAELVGDHVAKLDLRSVRLLGDVSAVKLGDVEGLLATLTSSRDFKGYDVKRTRRGVEIYAPRLRSVITGRLTNVREDVNDVWSYVSQIALLLDANVALENIKDVTAQKSTIVDTRTSIRGVTVTRENWVSKTEDRSNLRILLSVE